MMKTFMIALLSTLALSITTSFAGNTAVVQGKEAVAPVAEAPAAPETCSKDEKGCDTADVVKEEVNQAPKQEQEHKQEAKQEQEEHKQEAKQEQEEHKQEQKQEQEEHKQEQPKG